MARSRTKSKRWISKAKAVALAERVEQELLGGGLTLATLTELVGTFGCELHVRLVEKGSEEDVESLRVSLAG